MESPLLTRKFLTLVVILQCGCTAPDRERSVEVRGDTTVIRYGQSANFDSAIVERTVFPTANPSDYSVGDITAVADLANDGVAIFDRAVPALFHFDSAGRFLGRIGRKGAGPGEYTNGVTSLAVSPDRRLWALDAAARRLLVMHADGTPVAHHLSPTSLFSDRSLSFDQAGHLRVRALVERRSPQMIWPWPIGQIVLDSEGKTIDTVAAPALSDGPTGSTGPYGRSKIWDMWGDLSAVARSDAYAVTLSSAQHRTFVRIERELTAVALSREEARWAATHSEAGSEVPKLKPLVKNILWGVDSTLWIQRSLPSVVTADADTADQPAERLAFDVYMLDGSIVGSVLLPVSGRVLAVSRSAVFVQHEASSGEVVLERFRPRWK